MNIIRKHKKDRTFTILNNSMLRQRNMSMKAKGLLCYLMSLPDGWELYKTELPNHFSDGKDAVNSALEELTKLGYVLIIEKPKEAGRFAGYDYEIYDEPIASVEGIPLRRSVISKPDAENPPLISTNKESTMINKKSDEELTHLKSLLLGSQSYLELVCMQSALPMEFIKFLLEKFFIELAVNEEMAKERADARSHFNRWVRQHHKKYREEFDAGRGNKSNVTVSGGLSV